MDEVDDDRDWHLSCPGFGADPVDLVVVAVDERDPAAATRGSRRWVSSKIWPTTDAVSVVTLATSHSL